MGTNAHMSYYNFYKLNKVKNNGPKLDQIAILKNHLRLILIVLNKPILTKQTNKNFLTKYDWK